MKPLFVILIATLLLGCVKQIRDAGIPPRLTAPTIQLTSPKDFQRYRGGQTVSITATITDNEQLEKVDLLVINRATGAQVLHLEKYLDVKSYSLSESFTPISGPRYTIKIEAIDRYNNNTASRIEISCN